MDVSRDRAERICSVLLSDSTDPLPNGLRFSICLTGDSVRLSAFHHLASLSLFLLASTRAQQFAKVGPAEEADTDAIKQIGTYMMKNSLVCTQGLLVSVTDYYYCAVFLRTPLYGQRFCCPLVVVPYRTQDLYGRAQSSSHSGERHGPSSCPGPVGAYHKGVPCPHVEDEVSNTGARLGSQLRPLP